MTMDQKKAHVYPGVTYYGDYVDNDEMLWYWRCKQPESEIVVEVYEEEFIFVLPPFFQEEWIEEGLWLVYNSLYFWLFGWPISIPVAIFMFSTLYVIAVINLFEIWLYEIGTYEEWFWGPVRRAVVAPMIYSLALPGCLVPIWHFFGAYLFSWWALSDYFDYKLDVLEYEAYRPIEYSWKKRMELYGV